MGNQRITLEQTIIHSAGDICKLIDDVVYEDAHNYTIKFLGLPSPQDFERIKFDGESATVDRWNIIFKNLNFLKCVELTVEVIGILSSQLILSILAGLFFVRNILNLKKIRISVIDSLLIYALYKAGKDNAVSDKEWFNAYLDLKKEGKKFYKDIKLSKLKKRAKYLSTLKVIKQTDDFKWQLNDTVELFE